MTLAGLAARNVLRNKFRALLTVLGVAVAVLTFICCARCSTRGRRRRLRGEGPPRHAPQDHLRDDAAQALHRTTSRETSRTSSAAPHARTGSAARTRSTSTSSSPRSRSTRPRTSRSTTRSSVPPAGSTRTCTTGSGAIVGDRSRRRWGGRSADKVMPRQRHLPDEGRSWTFNIDGIYDVVARSRSIGSRSSSTGTT